MAIVKQKDPLIRNFSVIAHIDHGKSTLADRFLELTGTVERRKMRGQFLDQMELEREKGITIKLQPVRMSYTLNAKPYTLNMIDTPGHVDFNYEVSRSLAAVEGAILLVDASQGIQAQTLANFNIAKKEGIAIIPAANKIDLETADVPGTVKALAELTGTKSEDVILVSGKTGAGVDHLLAAVIERVPPPEIKTDDPLQALIFDSEYESHKGVVAYVRVQSGVIRPGKRLRFASSRRPFTPTPSKVWGFTVLETGIFKPDEVASPQLQSGEIGWVATGVKEAGAVKVGDTIVENESTKALPGYREPKPMIWANIIGVNQDDFLALKEALYELKLNDAALFFKEETLPVFGKGFRCGFLGLLHLEIIVERLKREFDLTPVVTAPSIQLKAKTKDGREIIVTSAAELNEESCASTEEPWMRVQVFTPMRYLGKIMDCIAMNRGRITSQESLQSESLVISAELPLLELMENFASRIKAITQGYGSLNYEFLEYRKSDVEKLGVIIAGERVDALSSLAPAHRKLSEARRIAVRLKDLIPRQQFEVRIQVENKGRIIASESIPALRKDVTGYLYGGDRTRKMKLWRKQKRGKQRLKAEGRVHLPQDVFVKMLQR